MRDYAKLYQSLLDDLGPLAASADFIRSDMTSKEAAAYSLMNSLYKKLSPNGDSKIADENALRLFREINASIGEFVEPRDSEASSYLYDLFKDEMYKALVPGPDEPQFDVDFIGENMGVGPGAAIGTNSDNFYTKLFDSPMTATDPYLIALYRAAISRTESWAEAGKLRFQQFGDLIVEGNRLFFAKKNALVSRTCCTEASANMLMQKALGAFIEQRLEKCFGIRLDTQPDINRRLARLGSLNGVLCTIDLKSASDSISWSFCQKVIPRSLLGFFRLFRSPSTILPDGSKVDLNMISTMGNGFTFPLQTLMFACAVKAVYIAKGITPDAYSDDPNYGVFGDDIVVVRDAYHSVCKLLTAFGFIVNDGKSFIDGPFRESCGFDFHNGYPIRGVYIKTLETPQGVYSAYNRLARWSAVHRIPLVRCLRLLRGWARFYPIPFSESDDAGFKVPSALKPRSVNADDWTIYKKMAPRSTVRRIPRDSTESKKFGFEGFNPHGWTVCFLGGYAHNPVRKSNLNPNRRDSRPDVFDYDQIGYRPKQDDFVPRFPKKSLIPWWDYFGADDPRFPRESFRDWKVLVELAHI